MQIKLNSIETQAQSNAQSGQATNVGPAGDTDDDVEMEGPNEQSDNHAANDDSIVTVDENVPDDLNQKNPTNQLLQLMQ